MQLSFLEEKGLVPGLTYGWQWKRNSEELGQRVLKDRCLRWILFHGCFWHSGNWPPCKVLSSATRKMHTFFASVPRMVRVGSIEENPRNSPARR